MDSIVGIDITASILILAEIGDKPQAYFANSAKFYSWAGLSPRNDQSAGKIKSKKIMPGNPYLKSVLCQCTRVAVRSRKNNFSIWYWSHRAKIRDKKCIVAVSRRMLALITPSLRSFYTCPR
jgi:transposase